MNGSALSGQNQAKRPGPTLLSCAFAMSIANFFARPHYQSEATQFINKLHKEDPQLTGRQQAGRALLWDQRINLQQKSDADAAEVPQKPYVYQTNPSQV